MNIRILSIDPGIHNTGWSLGIYDTVAEKFTVEDLGMIYASKLAKSRYRSDFNDYQQVIVHKVYQRELHKLIHDNEPDFIACEGAFYNMRTPNAFISIGTCIQSLKSIAYLFMKTPYMVAPRLAKAAVFGHGSAKKDDVASAIAKNEDIILGNRDLTEHECDSIAIGYGFAKAILPDLHEDIVSLAVSPYITYMVTWNGSIDPANKFVQNRLIENIVNITQTMYRSKHYTFILNGSFNEEIYREIVHHLTTSGYDIAFKWYDDKELLDFVKGTSIEDKRWFFYWTDDISTDDPNYLMLRQSIKLKIPNRIFDLYTLTKK